MVIRPWVVPYTTVYRFVWISGSLGAELPYRPVFTMLGVEKLDELVEGVSVGELRVRLRGAGPGGQVMLAKFSNSRRN